MQILRTYYWLFGLALFYGFFTRLIADTVSGQSNFWGVLRGLSEFQTWGLLTLILAFILNKRYNLSLWKSVLLTAAWPAFAFLAYTFEGYVHNIAVQPGLSYSLWNDFWVRLSGAAGFGAIFGAIAYFNARVSWIRLLAKHG